MLFLIIGENYLTSKALAIAMVGSEGMKRISYKTKVELQTQHFIQIISLPNGVHPFLGFHL